MKKEYEVVDTMDDTNTTSKDFLLGVIVGGVVGAATALFLAPKPGKELMNDLNAHAGVLKDKGIELSGTVKDKSTEFISIARDKTGNLTNTVSKHSTDLMDKVKGKTNNNKQETTSELFEVREEETVGQTSSEPFQVEYDEIQKKLEETKKAFDETESKYNQ